MRNGNEQKKNKTILPIWAESTVAHLHLNGSIARLLPTGGSLARGSHTGFTLIAAPSFRRHIDPTCQRERPRLPRQQNASAATISSPWISQPTAHAPRVRGPHIRTHKASHDYHLRTTRCIAQNQSHTSRGRREIRWEGIRHCSSLGDNCAVGEFLCGCGIASSVVALKKDGLAALIPRRRRVSAVRRARPCSLSISGESTLRHIRSCLGIA
jgi:hypothetical protein